MASSALSILLSTRHTLTPPLQLSGKFHSPVTTKPAKQTYPLSISLTPLRRFTSDNDSFSPEELTKLMRECNDIEGNAVATLAVRRFLERWRKEFKKSVKHWLITELGHNNTERIHIHGIIFTDNVKEIVKHWKYGNVTIGKTMFKNEDWEKANKLTSYVSARTVNYIVKYVIKIDSINKGFEGKILCSAGLGKNYLSKFDSKQNRFKGNETNENYKLPNGANVNLPISHFKKIMLFCDPSS